VELVPHWLHGGTLTVEGRRVAVGVEGLDGVTVAVRGTGPEKRLKLFMVMVEFAELPGRRVRVFGAGLSENDGAQNWPPRQEILQAVSGCISQPEKAWSAMFTWSGSQ
jgi:hypothetical protein